jgi:hypothetical protein
MVAELKRQRTTEDLDHLARTPHKLMEGEPTRHSDLWSAVPVVNGTRLPDFCAL